MHKIVNGVTIPLTAAEISELNASKPTEAQILAQRWEGVRTVSYTHLTLPTTG